MLNLDTHILIHALTGNLLPKERKLLIKNPWSISSIVLWEIAKLNQIGRIEVSLNDSKVEQTLSKIYVWPITLKICQTLKELDFKSDPADEIIAATSLVHKIPLVTRDKTIKKSKLIKIL